MNFALTKVSEVQRSPGPTPMGVPPSDRVCMLTICVCSSRVRTTLFSSHTPPQRWLSREVTAVGHGDRFNNLSGSRASIGRTPAGNPPEGRCPELRAHARPESPPCVSLRCPSPAPPFPSARRLQPHARCGSSKCTQGYRELRTPTRSSHLLYRESYYTVPSTP